jgi:cytidylate kinase
VGVVTLSASYAAGGSEVGPAVAERLGLPFVDRAIPVAVAERLDVPLDQVEAADGKSEAGVWWALTSMAMVPDLAGAGALAYVHAPDENAFREQTERVLREIAAGTGGVILGRAAAIVLADVPDALHVRLDGPPAARTEAAMRQHGISAEAARDHLKENDSARTGYVRHFYRCEPTDCRLYHLVIDSTAMPWLVVTDLIVEAARARGIGG